MFIDNVKIFVRSGNGGKGCKCFYRDKYNRKGFPDGGDGGRGADIIVRADRNLHTLLDFRYNQHFYGVHGAHGSGKNKKGKDIPPIVIRVPCGTVVKDAASDCVLRDLTIDQDQVIVAIGGRGGRGNQHHREVTEPKAGEEKNLLLDLRVIADAGVVGFPNAGKSTLVSGISNAHPKIAAYPFTTLFPVLGVAHFQDKAFVIADLPGLIEGASEGKGLGDKFLRHAQRTKILIHLIDMAACDQRDPLSDYKTINQELRKYNKDIYTKDQIIVANKMDLPAAKGNLKKFKRSVRKKIYPVSALNKEGLEELIEAIAKKL